MLKYILLLSTILAFISCEPRESNKSAKVEIYEADSAKIQASMVKSYVEPLNPMMPYDLSKPSVTFELDKELQEISGLSIAPNPNQLVAVNDEKGHLYFLNKMTGEIEKEVDFGKKGDYEGVETVGNEIFMVESDGTLQRIQRIGGEDEDTDKFENKLGKKYDVEGLTYDAAANELLVACKGKAGTGDQYDNMRAIYSFDLKTKGYSKRPAYLISRDEIEDYFDTNLKEEGWSAAMRALIDPDAPLDAFGPSGIAIHPKTGNFFILSSVGKLVVVLNPNGKIEHVEGLDKKIHRQPEGICFDADGTLYISNE
ncbi:MAG: hypothetical protein ACI9JY_002436, partial [Saprospiraceae bacterium]